MYIGPLSRPKMLSLFNITSHTITLTWGPPLIPNGVIRYYLLQCSDSRHNELVNGSVIVTSTVTATTLSGLLPYTNYSCSIAAHTSVGGGPAATIDVTTRQDGNFPLKCSYI